MKPRIYDFHTHTFHSDGILSPMELIRQAHRRAYTAIGITDHIGAGGLERHIEELTVDCEIASVHWDIIAIPGVEFTHVPPAMIHQLAARAKSAGAKIVTVHGETPYEGVAGGTNHAAVTCPDVDILAHPGLIEPEDVAIAVDKGKYLELSGRRDHCLANGRIVALAREKGAMLLVNSDAHTPQDLFSLSSVKSIALAAGLSEAEAEKVLFDNPQSFLKKLGYDTK